MSEGPVFVPNVRECGRRLRGVSDLTGTASSADTNMITLSAHLELIMPQCRYPLTRTARPRILPCTGRAHWAPGTPATGETPACVD